MDKVTDLQIVLWQCHVGQIGLAYVYSIPSKLASLAAKRRTNYLVSYLTSLSPVTRRSSDVGWCCESVSRASSPVQSQMSQIGVSWPARSVAPIIDALPVVEWRARDAIRRSGGTLFDEITDSETVENYRLKRATYKPCSVCIRFVSDCLFQRLCSSHARYCIGNGYSTSLIFFIISSSHKLYLDTWSAK